MSSATELEKLVVRLVGDSSSYDKMLKDADKNLLTATSRMEKSIGGMASRAGAALSKLGDGFKRLGRKMTLMLTLPLAGMAVTSLIAFSSFDDAMTKSLAIMGDVTDEMRSRMEQAAFDISSTSITAPKDLAEAYFFLASAGMDAEQSMASLATVEQFAVAGAFDMALATDLLTDAQTAMGLASEDAGQNLLNLTRISDVFVKANQSANTSVQQVSEAMTADAGTAARNFGSSLETTVAILDAYASAGKKGAEAGNLFGRMTRLLTKAQRDNGEEFEKLGIQVIGADGDYRNLIDILGDMENAFKDMTRPQRDAALEMLGFEALAQKSITPLLGLNKEMKKYEKQMLAAGGATKEVADKQLKSFSAQLKILKNNIAIAAAEVGKILAPTITFLSGKLMVAVKWFQTVSDTTKKWIVGILAVVSGMGPLLIIIGSLIGAVASFVSIIGVMAFIGIKVIAIIALIAIKILVVAAVLAVVTVAVVAFLAYLIGPDSLASAWDTIVAKAKSAFQFIKGFVSNFSQNMKILFEWLKSNWVSVFVEMGRMFLVFTKNMVKNTIVAVKIFIRMFNALKGFMTTWAKGAANQVVKATKGIMVRMVLTSSTFAKKAWDNFTNIFKGKKALPASEIEAMGEKFMSDFERGAESDNIFKTLKDIFDEEKGGFVNPLEGFKSSLEVPEFNLIAAESEKAAEKITTFKGAVEASAKSVKALAEIDKELMASLEGNQKSLLEQVATFGMTARQADILKLSLRGLTGAQLMQSRILDAQLTAMEKYQKQVEEAKNLTEEFKSPLEKFADEQKKLEELFDLNLLSVETFNAAMKDMEDSLRKENKIKFSVSGIQAVEAGTAEAAARLEAFRALAKKPVNIPGVIRKNAADDEARKAKGAQEFLHGDQFVARTTKAAQADLGKLMMKDTETQKAILAASQEIAANTKPKKAKTKLRVADLGVSGSPIPGSGGGYSP